MTAVRQIDYCAGKHNYLLAYDESILSSVLEQHFVMALC